MILVWLVVRAITSRARGRPLMPAIASVAGRAPGIRFLLLLSVLFRTGARPVAPRTISAVAARTVLGNLLGPPRRRAGTALGATPVAHSTQPGVRHTMRGGGARLRWTRSHHYNMISTPQAVPTPLRRAGWSPAAGRHDVREPGLLHARFRPRLLPPAHRHRRARGGGTPVRVARPVAIDLDQRPEFHVPAHISAVVACRA